MDHQNGGSTLPTFGLCTGPWRSVGFETVPLIKRLQDSPVSPADADDQAFQPGTTPCRLTSSATVRERRRCLSAEDHTPPGMRTPSSRVPGREDTVVTSRAPCREDSAARSPRERCHSSNESTSKAPTEASSSVSNFLSPSTTSTTTATPSSTSSSPARRASCASLAIIFVLASFFAYN